MYVVHAGIVTGSKSTALSVATTCFQCHADGRRTGLKIRSSFRGSQGQGIGAGLLKDALLRTLLAADIAGIRAVAVHAQDENARRFNAHFGFIPSPTDALHLYLLVKDINHSQSYSGTSGQGFPSMPAAGRTVK